MVVLLLGLGCDNMQNFLNFKLQRCDACQNRVEFCHKPIGVDAVISKTGFYTLETDTKTLSSLVSNTRLRPRLKILESIVQAFHKIFFCFFQTEIEI